MKGWIIVLLGLLALCASSLAAERDKDPGAGSPEKAVQARAIFAGGCF